MFQLLFYLLIQSIFFELRYVSLLSCKKMSKFSVKIVPKSTNVERIGLMAFRVMFNGLNDEVADLSRRHKSDDSTLSSCTCSFEGQRNKTIVNV